MKEVRQATLRLFPEEAKEVMKIQNIYNVIFQNQDGEVGRLEFEGNKMVFKGKVKKSAKVFFDFLLKNIVDEYMKEKLIKEKK